MPYNFDVPLYRISGYFCKIPNTPNLYPWLFAIREFLICKNWLIKFSKILWHAKPWIYGIFIIYTELIFLKTSLFSTLQAVYTPYVFNKTNFLDFERTWVYVALKWQCQILEADRRLKLWVSLQHSLWTWLRGADPSRLFSSGEWQKDELC